VSIPELDPQIRKVVEDAEAAGGPPVEEWTPEQVRANLAANFEKQFGPADEVHSVEDADADGVPVRIYRPTETDEPGAEKGSTALVYFHGGGFVAGSVEVYDPLARAFAKRAGCVVISVDYRLAPEHPYPAALDDAWTATKWVTSNAKELGLDELRIGVGGDSAGGALAAICARRARDRGIAIAAQLLLYPITNHDLNTPSYSLFSQGYLLTRDAMDWYWKQYLGEGDGGENPDVSPAAERDLRRLPRAIIVTAEADVLRDEAEAYAQRLFISTVETEGYRYDGMVHGFLRMAGVVDRSKQALDEISESLTAALEKGYSN
jgi:acetyl esterase/lipase